jgi:hemerythrin-like domain-containing protein
MARPTEGIREHHKMLEERLHGFWHNIESLQKFSDQERELLDDLMTFLKEELLPHAEGEEKHLYGKVAELMRNPLFTKTMEMDHQFIKQYITELETVIKNVHKESADVTIKRIQTTASKLQGIVDPHFQKENEVYLPILDEKLSKEQVQKEVIEPMHAYSGRHEGHGHGHGHHH